MSAGIGQRYARGVRVLDVYERALRKYLVRVCLVARGKEIVEHSDTALKPSLLNTPFASYSSQNSDGA